VRLQVGGGSSQANADVCLLRQTKQKCSAIFGGGVEALEQLLRRQHDLIGGLAPAREPAHAVGDHPQHAAAPVRQQAELILLIRPIADVDAGAGAEAIGGAHGWGL